MIIPYLDAVDTVCMNCIEDTLNNEEICETCPVRKSSDIHRSRIEELIKELRNKLYGLSCYYVSVIINEGEIKVLSDVQLISAIHNEVFHNISDDTLREYIDNDLILTDEVYNLADDIARKIVVGGEGL